MRRCAAPLPDEMAEVPGTSKFLRDHRHARRHTGARPRWIVVVDVYVHRQPATEQAAA